MRTARQSGYSIATASLVGGFLLLAYGSWHGYHSLKWAARVLLLGVGCDHTGLFNVHCCLASRMRVLPLTRCSMPRLNSGLLVPRQPTPSSCLHHGIIMPAFSIRLPGLALQRWSCRCTSSTRTTRPSSGSSTCTRSQRRGECASAAASERACMRRCSYAWYRHFYVGLWRLLCRRHALFEIMFAHPLSLIHQSVSELNFMHHL